MRILFPKRVTKRHRRRRSAHEAEPRIWRPFPRQRISSHPTEAGPQSRAAETTDTELQRRERRKRRRRLRGRRRAGPRLTFLNID